MIYKKALMSKLRIETNKGMLSIERLFDLDLNELKSTLIKLNNEIEDSGSSLDFLEKTVDNKKQEMFDIVKDIYLTKLDILNNSREEASKKLKNKEILEIIKRKEQQALENMSVEDLKKLLEN